MGALNFEKIVGLVSAISQRHGICSLSAEEAEMVMSSVGETSVSEALQMLDDILQHGSMAR